MAHFYNCTDLQNPYLDKEVETPAQAKKKGKHYYPSCTTIIGQTIKDPFLDSIHKPRSMVQFARMQEHEDKNWKDLERLCYGEVQSPSGETIPSSEFGTSVHASAEKLLDSVLFKLPYEDDIYDPWAEPFVQWVQEEGHSIVATEYMVADRLIKTCGTVDVVLRHKDTKELFICDYKCRKNKQFYPKDLWQMAIECEMLRRRGLDYLPKCMSVCIDINTKEHYHKIWTEEAQKEAIKIVKYISKLYWMIRM